jgi:hypothetical protein
LSHGQGGVGSLPDELNSNGDFSFYVKSTTIPKVEIDQTEVSFLSQKFVIPKQVKYGDSWKCKLLVDGKLTMYNALYEWQESLANLKNNGGGYKVIPDVYAKVKLLNAEFDTNNPKNTFTLVGVFPSDIPKINLEYKNAADIIEVDCTLTYQYMYHDEVESNPLDANS